MGTPIAIAGVIAILFSLPGPARGNPSAASADQQQQGAAGQVEIEIPGKEDADLVLDLQGAVDAALDNSFGIFSLQQNYLQTQYSLEGAKRSLRTRVDLRTQQGLLNISQRINAQLIGVPPELNYLRRNSTSSDLYLIATQPLITDGWLSFSTGIQGNQAIQDVPGGLPESKNRSIQPYAGLGFTQPLFQYNQLKGQLQSNQLSVESESLRYTEQELAIINQVTQFFYNLFQQQRRVEIAAEDYTQSEVNLQTGLRQYQAARQDEVQVLQLRVQRGNALNTLEREKTTLEERRFEFNRLVGLPLETAVWIDTSLEFVPIEIDMERAMELALNNRSDVRQQEIQLEQNNLTLRQNVSNGRPDLEFTASYSITGNSTLGALGYNDPWSKHLNAALDSDNTSPFTNISLTLQVPIFDWGRNASYVQRQLSIINEQERRIKEAEADLRVQVINRVRAVEGYMRRLEILEESLQVARTSYTISQQQYERGEIDLNTLFTAQGQLRNTEMEHLTTRINYEMAKANLKEITLWDWETNQRVAQRTEKPVPFAKSDRSR